MASERRSQHLEPGVGDGDLERGGAHRDPDEAQVRGQVDHRRAAPPARGRRTGVDRTRPSSTSRPTSAATVVRDTSSRSVRSTRDIEPSSRSSRSSRAWMAFSARPASGGAMTEDGGTRQALQGGTPGYRGAMELLTGLGLASAAGLNAYVPLLALALLARWTELVELPGRVGVAAGPVGGRGARRAPRRRGGRGQGPRRRPRQRPAADRRAARLRAGWPSAPAPTRPRSWRTRRPGCSPATGCRCSSARASRWRCTCSSRAGAPWSTRRRPGSGAPVASTAEDALAVGLSLAALLLPVLVLVLVVVLVVAVVRLRDRRRRRARPSPPEPGRRGTSRGPGVRRPGAQARTSRRGLGRRHRAVQAEALRQQAAEAEQRPALPVVLDALADDGEPERVADEHDHGRHRRAAAGRCRGARGRPCRS